MPRRLCPRMFALVVAALVTPGAAAQERANRLISLLEAGKPAVGVWTAATTAPRITKVLATSDADYIVADIEHEVFDFPALRSFLLGVQDFSLRYRTEARSAPADAARILKMCLDRKVVAAVDATPADVQAKTAAGYRMLSVGWDYALLQRALGDTVKAMRK